MSVGKSARSLGVTALWAMTMSAAHAADLGADGRLHLASGSLAHYDFEDATKLAAVLEKPSDSTGILKYTPMTADEITPLLVASNDALEGTTSLVYAASDGIGVTIVDPTVFGTLTGQRVRISLWGRADGMEPFVIVSYGDSVDITDFGSAWARVAAIRTGRETSDGWVEFSTGDIDGSVIDRPIHDITITGRVQQGDTSTSLLYLSAPHPTDAMSIDALEIVPGTGTPSTGACTATTVDSACGAGSECYFGHCIDSAVVWGALPPLAMQKEITARVAYYAQHVLGDRHATAAIDAAWVTKTLALASDAATPRTFFGGLNQQVVAIRDAHTSLGEPQANGATPFFTTPYNSSGILDVCFGPTVNDLTDGKLAYVVWALGPDADPSIQVGDVLTQIDGMDPMTWVEAVYPRYTLSMPNDPTADWAPTARDLATLVSSHASTLTFSRCAGSTCTALPPFDAASAALATTGGGKYGGYGLTCQPRFTDLVAGSHTDANGGNALLSAAIDAQTVGIEFDGFEPSDPNTWASALDAAFQLPHTNVIVDAREGFGGEDDLGQYLFQQLRGTDSPAALALAGRGAFDAPDAAPLFAFDWSACSENYSWQCSVFDIDSFVPSAAMPPGDASKVAWLDTDDVSNNDMVPLLLKGRANLQIFAPVPTYGAVGNIEDTPPLLGSWYGGSIAVTDGRYATTLATAETTMTCSSGTGVAPDQIVTQKLSDVLTGTDTIVAAARAWLAQ